MRSVLLDRSCSLYFSPLVTCSSAFYHLISYQLVELYASALIVIPYLYTCNSSSPRYGVLVFMLSGSLVRGSHVRVMLYRVIYSKQWKAETVIIRTMRARCKRACVHDRKALKVHLECSGRIRFGGTVGTLDSVGRALGKSAQTFSCNDVAALEHHRRVLV